ncbi:hypothetical protein [Chitiniphilus shinanonensis]|uniref:hypothetical protein n=1 Tax=Chitiniphilus shinanonensis TaxID=553088 RepID=UPI0024E0D3E9|nr:hypothetical protein [Chitiniphilus shinanonensis]
MELGELLYLLEGAGASYPLGQGERLEPGDAALLAHGGATLAACHGLVLPGYRGSDQRRCKCQIPVALGPGWRARVVAGELDGVTGPLPWPRLLVDVFLEPLATLALPAGIELRVLEGEVAREDGGLRALTRAHLLAWQVAAASC